MLPLFPVSTPPSPGPGALPGPTKAASTAVTHPISLLAGGLFPPLQNCSPARTGQAVPAPPPPALPCSAVFARWGVEIFARLSTWKCLTPAPELGHEPPNNAPLSSSHGRPSTLTGQGCWGQREGRLLTGWGAGEHGPATGMCCWQGSAQCHGARAQAQTGKGRAIMLPFDVVSMCFILRAVPWQCLRPSLAQAGSQV